jgi:putative DNA primase/helicase
MTAIARRGLDHAPLHGMDAPVAGSGKSLIFEIASILATGHEAVVMAQGETQEEFEKRLGTVLMRGDQLIVIDNCDNPLEGQTLNQCITQPLVQCRILGKSEMPWVQTAAMVGANGNNLLLVGDVVRRSIVGRLDPKCARPETRQYNFDPIAYAYENRPQLVVDILTLLKAYHNAGCPVRPPALQSFVHWSNTVRACIIWLGKAYRDAKLDDPCKTIDRVRSNDPVLGQMRTILAAWYTSFAEQKKTAAEAVAAAEATMLRLVEMDGGKAGTERFQTNPSLRDALLSVAGKSGGVEISALGRWLGRHAGRQVDFDDGSSITLAFAGLRDGNRQWQAIRAPTEQPAESTAAPTELVPELSELDDPGDFL